MDLHPIIYQRMNGNTGNAFLDWLILDLARGLRSWGFDRFELHSNLCKSIQSPAWF